MSSFEGEAVSQGTPLWFSVPFCIVLFCGLARCQTPESITITISPQRSPYTLPKGLTLYSAVACSTATRPRAISAGQIRQAAESQQIQFQDPATLPPMITRYVARTRQGRALSSVSYLSTGTSIASAGVAAYKASKTSGNVKTWSEISLGMGIIGAGIPIAQKNLQGDVAAEQATITNGVKAALMSDMSSVYDVPAGGCSRSVMFLGAGADGVVKAVLP